jgi:uncharacterized sulfatase
MQNPSFNTDEKRLETKPNFIIIFGETQGANVIGAYGNEGVQTPNTDLFAQNATLFSRGYTTCPLCTPARSGMFTGIYSHTNGAWANNLPLGNNILTMGQRFRDAGYLTVYTGKWHLDSHDYFGTGFCPDGWEEKYWYDGKRYLSDLSEVEINLWRKGLNSLEVLKTNEITADFTWGHRIFNRAIEFLKTHDPNQPYLLVIAPDEPHHPFTCPPEYVERFIDFKYPLGPAGYDSLTHKPDHQREWADSIKRYDHQPGFTNHPLYFGCNSFIDEEYGRLFQAAEKYTPHNTYIILTCDHGDMLGAHQLWGKGPAMYEEITHIPFIIRQPSDKNKPMVNPTPVSQIDILPTMLEIAGLEIPPILEGKSLVPYLNGDTDLNRNVIIEFNRYEIEHDSWGGFQPVRCLVSGNYKLVINMLSQDEFYDLERDPNEIDNLIHDPNYSEIRNRLHTQLINWMNDKRDPFRGPSWERRLWSNSNRLKWMGNFRPRPADGYAPEVRYYDTGMPAKGVKIEHRDQ